MTRVVSRTAIAVVLDVVTGEDMTVTGVAGISVSQQHFENLTECGSTPGKYLSWEVPCLLSLTLALGHGMTMESHADLSPR